MKATATRPVITGIGVAAPTGLGADAYWSAMVDGANGIAEITRFDASGYPVRLAGEVSGFEATAHIPSRLLPQTDHMTRLALCAADEALKDSGLDLAAMDPYDAGVSSASSMGGFEFGQRELQNLWSKGGQFVSAYQSFAWFYAVNTGQISIRHGLKGPSSAVVTDQAGGLDAIGHARRQIRKGTKVMLAGGVDGALCPLGLAGHLAASTVSARRPAPTARTCPSTRPPQAMSRARAARTSPWRTRRPPKGAAPACTVSSPAYAATFDPDPRDAGADGLERAIRAALADAERSPDAIAVVFADAVSVPEADRAEAAALAAVFGVRGVPVAAPKAQTGRLYAGGAALDLVSALLALRDGSVPPTAHVTSLAADCPVDLVTGEARPLTGDAALVLARGEGGFNAAAVVTSSH